MTRYKVKVIYKYSDTIDVEAESKEEAEKIALEECNEQCEILYDVIVTEK